MRVLSRASAAALLAAGVAAGASQTPPKSPEQDRQRPPTFRTEANFVRVDVYPTIGGKPLDDLRRDDFELLEDGRPQTVDTFEHVRISAAGRVRANPDSLESMRHARLSNQDPGVTPFTESLRLNMSPDGPPQALLFRRGRVRLKLPISSEVKPGSGVCSTRLTADVTLAALGAGDYVVEIDTRAAASEERVLTAIRVTR